MSRSENDLNMQHFKKAWGSKAGNCRAGGTAPTTPTLVGPKILSFTVKALHFQTSRRSNNYQFEVLFKWSGQSCTPSAGFELIDEI